MDPYIGEIRIFAGNYAPRGWALCNGQTLPISQNTALFSLLGVTYGGDGRSNFGLPDFQGRAPMHWGNGAGLSQRNLGEKAGSPSVTLTGGQQPSHTHSLNGVPGGGRGGGGFADQSSPANNAFGQPQSDALYVTTIQNVVAMSSSAIGAMGGSQPHNNMQPYQALSFIIALQGAFPPRS